MPAFAQDFGAEGTHGLVVLDADDQLQQIGYPQLLIAAST
ncbi:hypothetical protein C4K00_3858 [Pseudomonas synxantha]|nr:hypothetical protein C4K00_3858 [Pseudomonas synxantha]AZE79669.1 hypothetical protein C4J99_3900 [Pseudomonas synxantha]